MTEAARLRQLLQVRSNCTLARGTFAVINNIKPHEVEPGKHALEVYLYI